MEQLSQKTAVVIAHYDDEGQLANHILNHIVYISTFTKNIIFVSTRLNAEGHTKLKPYAKVIERPNYGYDFWSYKTGLETIDDFNNVEHIIMWNSSFICFEPKKLYTTFFNGLRNEGIYGISACDSPKFHIQTYFFSFYGKSVIQSLAFKNWWLNMTPISDRQEVILRYEIGMSEWFLAHQFKLNEMLKLSYSDKLKIMLRYIRYVKINSVSLRKIFYKNKLIGYKQLNMTHFNWENIFNKFGLIKIELLKKNPTRQKLENLNSMLSDENLILLQDGLNAFDKLRS